MKLIRVPRNPSPYLDVVKLLAIVMVVFNHTGNSGYKMYLDVMDEPIHSLIMGYSAFIKIAVPLFFMASGALLLKREEPYGKILLKRALRFVIILAVVSFIFYYDAYGRKGEMSVGDFFVHVYKNDLTGHLWYLYSYICYMLMLPFLRKLAQTMRAKDYLLLIIIYQVAQPLPIVDYAIFQGSAAHTSYLNFFMAMNYVVYPLMGYYIDNQNMEDEREETPYVLLFFSILAIAITCSLMDWRYGLDGGWTSNNREAYMSSFSLIPAITVFYAVKRMFAHRTLKKRTANLLFVLGSCTFGVYLFDPKWRSLTQGIRTMLTPVIGLYFATHVQVICACIVGIAATYIYKCITGGVMLLSKRILHENLIE